IYPVDLPLLASIQGRRYAFEVEVITRALWRGLRVVTVAVPVYYPPHGRVSHFHPWRDNMLLSWTHTKLCTLRLLKLVRLYRPQAPSHR
ncbi:hypothetical protein ABI055_14655, partial [Enterococcus faecium]|uniref:hypothetical protein n=1 Tax=Enterococcus faecium TaxID=1352 RepID=UPI003F43D4E8